MSLFSLCTHGLCTESRLSSKKHGSSRLIVRCPPRSHQLQVGKFSSTLSPVYATLEVSSLDYCSPFSFTLSFSLVLLLFSPASLCPSPLIRTTTLHCSSESSRRLPPITLPRPARGHRPGSALTVTASLAPQIAFIGANSRFLRNIQSFRVIKYFCVN